MENENYIKSCKNNDDFQKMLNYVPKDRGNNDLENSKSCVMNFIESELKNIIETLVVKQTYIADRYETPERAKLADEYLSAKNSTDNFWTYSVYSEYALNKVGINDMRCRYDKTLIPDSVKKNIVKYQKEYVLKNYVELNDYYRELNGLPNLNDCYIYVERQITGIDITKPIHEMNEDEILILLLEGELDKIKDKYPEKRYLNHLLKDTKIPLKKARTANDFEILYIRKDRTREQLTNKFVVAYNQARDYIITRFNDDVYTKNSPYYKGFIGLCILVVAIQRFISGFYYNLINRDFFDKELLKMFFDSYNIPYYNKIPLAYLVNIAKNLNRLLQYKATDKVFVNIFKIFGLDDVNIYNYILFKDIKFDNTNKPINIYVPNKNLGYMVETKTFSLISKSEQILTKNHQVNNINKMRYFSWKNKLYKIYYRYNQLVYFSIDTPKDVFGEFNFNKSEEFNQYTFDENINIEEFYSYTDDENNIYSFIFISREGYLYYLDQNDGMKMYDLNTISDGNVILNTKFKFYNNKYILALNHYTGCEVFEKQLNGTFTKIFKDNKNIVDVDMYDNSYVLTMSNGSVYVKGDNKNKRLLIPDKENIESFTELINNNPVDVVKSRIFDNGTVFIINDGTVRWTGNIPEFNMNQTTPGFNELRKNFTNVKDIRIINDGTRNIGILRFFNDNIVLYNYKYTDKFGCLLYNTELYNQKFPKYRFVGDFHIYPKLDEIILTQFNQKSETNVSIITDEEQISDSRSLPFIKSGNIIKDINTERMVDIELYDSVFYFIDEQQVLKFYNYQNKQYDVIRISEIPQNIFKAYDGLYVTTGTKCIYKVTVSNGAEKINTESIIVSIIDNYNEVLLVDNLNKIYNISGKEVTETLKITNKKDKETYIVIRKDSNLYLNYIDEDNNIVKKLNNIENCSNILINETSILLNGTKLFYIEKSDIIDKNVEDITPIALKEINNNRERYKIFGNDIINFNKNGGITLLSNFSLLDKFQVDLDDYYVDIYDSNNSYIQDFTMDDNNLIFLKNTLQTKVYEYDYQKMFDLHFVQVPFDTDNLSSDLCSFENFENYELVVHDDDLWGDGDNRAEFKKKILENEFNYMYTKYIAVTSMYNLTRLNFETCYMFKMLHDLKPNEKYLSIDVPFIGRCKLFDIIVALYAITCYKFGMEGNIIDTTTKAMSVLGFNFKQDEQYIRQIIDNCKTYGDIYIDQFDEDGNIIEQPPKYYKITSDLTNTYLDNIDVVKYVYKCKYNSTNIKEYNAFKRIEQATVYSKYSSDEYRIDGVLPKTYAEYLKYTNTQLYQFVKDTNDINLVEQLDLLLSTLTEYLDSEEFKYLFINIPSLSIDTIRKFIYYLIDIFKSYTVELKAMNVIYEIDDKYVHNIKLILSEQNFDKFFELNKTLKYDFADMIDDMQKEHITDDQLKFYETLTLSAILEMTDNIKIKDKILLNKYIELYDSVSLDFIDTINSDKFDEIKDILLNYYDKLYYNAMLELCSKMTIIDTKQMMCNVDIINKLNIKCKQHIVSNFVKDSIIKIKDSTLHDSIIKIKDMFNNTIKDSLTYSIMNNTIYDSIPMDMLEILQIKSSFNTKSKISIRDEITFIREEK